MTRLSDSLAGATLVVAHPDDEILWFSSIFDRVGAIIVCYLDVPGREDWTRGRHLAIREYPRSNVEFLGLVESVSFRGADWGAPEECPEGLALSRNPATLPGFDPDRYRENHGRLIEALRPRLSGVRHVVTHNPWGEYGHEEHVQVYRAVSILASSLGFGVWYSNYTSDRSFRLMQRHVDGWRSQGEVLATQPDVVAPVEALYRRHGCWTWPFEDYVYFPTECFLREGSAMAGARGSTIPLNYIQIIDNPPLNHHDHDHRIRRAARSAFRALRKAMR